MAMETEFSEGPCRGCWIGVARDLASLSGIGTARLSAFHRDVRPFPTSAVTSISVWSAHHPSSSDFSWLNEGTLRITPNPFASQATIKYGLDKGGDVSIHICDVQGRMIDRLERGTQPAGQHSFEWQIPDAGQGVYFVKLIVDGAEYTSKSLRIR